VTSGIEEYADIRLRLMDGDAGTESDRLGDGRIEVTHLKVKVHHRTLVSRLRRPHGGLEVGGFLEHDVDRSIGRRDDCRARFLMDDRPTQQLGVETCQGAGIRSFYGGSPPHTGHARVHDGILSKCEGRCRRAPRTPDGL